MKNFFNPDNTVMQFITKTALSVYLNILWFICCIPVVTAGASTTALFYVTLKMARNEEGNITKDFFHSFKSNFRQSTIVWLILLGIGIILGIDGYVLYHLRFENVFWTIITAVFIVAVIAYAIVLLYIFPLMARFENTIPAMFKNSIITGMRFLLCTVLMMVIYFIIYNDSGCNPFLHTGNYLWRRTLCIFMLLSSFQHYETSGGKKYFRNFQSFTYMIFIKETRL